MHLSGSQLDLGSPLHIRRSNFDDFDDQILYGIKTDFVIHCQPGAFVVHPVAKEGTS